jgi:ankyrin repeat protein
VIICFDFSPFSSVSGQSSLHWSSVEGHIDVCQFLVERKADVNAKDNKYITHLLV